MSAEGSLFLFGLGYSSGGVARQAQKRGWCVTSTARQPAKFALLQAERHRITRFDPEAQHLLDADGVLALQTAQYVLTSIPPVAAKLYDPVLAAQHRALRQAAEAGKLPAALGYLSSTGVYGDWAGDWVDETSETRTATARGLLRLEAEQAWMQLAEQLQLPLTIFRLGGIYGPRRSVLSNLQAEVPSRASAARRSRQRFTSRCHVADVAQAVLADMQHRKQQANNSTCSTNALVDILNVVDDEPAPRGEVEAYAQLLLQQGGRRPQAVANADSGWASDAEHSQPQPETLPLQQQDQQTQQRPRRGQELLEEKRVRNMKLKQLLQAHSANDAGLPTLVAPTYREGLTLIMEGTEPFEQQDLDCLYNVTQG